MSSLRVSAVRDREGDVEHGDGDGDHRLQRRWPPRAGDAHRCPILRAAYGGITICAQRGTKQGSIWASPVSPDLGGGRRGCARGASDRRGGQSSCGGPIYPTPSDGRRGLRPGRRGGSRRAARSCSRARPRRPCPAARRPAPRPDSHRPRPGRAGTGGATGPEGHPATTAASRPWWPTPPGRGPSLALIGALVGIALAGGWNRFIRRRRSSARSQLMRRTIAASRGGDRALPRRLRRPGRSGPARAVRHQQGPTLNQQDLKRWTRPGSAHCAS